MLTTTGEASVFTGITERVRYKATVSRLTDPLVVFSEIGNCRLSFGQSRTGTRLITPRIAIWNFCPEILDGYRLVLSVGHDEYWSAPMRDSLEAFIAKGGNAAFFSGNSVCWQVRSEDDGRALRLLEANLQSGSSLSKPMIIAPSVRSGVTIWWTVRENQLTGVGFPARRLSS